MSLEEMTTIDRLKSWTAGVELDWDTVQQLRNIADLPILAGHVAVMPDVHLGKGATVGSVIPTQGAIIPAAVGVDIGCGMAAVRTEISANQLPHSLRRLRSRIEERVPVGFGAHDRPLNPLREGPLREGLRGVALSSAGKKLGERYEKLAIMDLIGKHDHKRTFNQLGTLGGGNHFIELCVDESGGVWVMLHSGSRNIGKTIGETAIHMARQIAEREERGLRDRDLAWLDEGSAEFDMYVEGLRWAQDYAAHNRALMMHEVLIALREEFRREIATFENAVQCHHNYASVEEHFGRQVWVTRKGAVSARRGELGIIPGSMGAKSFIVRGKGNADSYCSCSHGAGRRLSRAAAKRSYTLADLKEQTAGVECRKDAGVLDEIPSAYKDIDTVMAAQADLVEVVHTLKQVMCIKG
jgi:tRNA-splicing ligase RtcB (3'-phosphate/5'-hydroxy nucleic acid ligase)